LKARLILAHLGAQCFSLTRRLRSARTVLLGFALRQFRQESGITITEYRTRQRLTVAIHHLHGDTGCAEAVALQAGWNSKKGLYNEVERLLTKVNEC
jgi:methylphosphotriester-DNA--protein-cysteine methyltransferase